MDVFFATHPLHSTAESDQWSLRSFGVTDNITMYAVLRRTKSPYPAVLLASVDSGNQFYVTNDWSVDNGRFPAQTARGMGCLLSCLHLLMHMCLSEKSLLGPIVHLFRSVLVSKKERKKKKNSAFPSCGHHVLP